MFNNNDFKDFDKRMTRARKVFWVFFLINTIITLSVIGGITWIAWHFISKFW